MRLYNARHPEGIDVGPRKGAAFGEDSERESHIERIGHSTSQVSLTTLKAMRVEQAQREQAGAKNPVTLVRRKELQSDNLE